MPGDVIAPGRVRLRHIKQAATGTTVLGTTFAGSFDGLNGRGGFVSGSLERRLYDVGTVSLRFPNAPGDDGVLHRERFAILNDPSYCVGDEWIEVWQDGDLLATVTPVSADLTRQEVSLSCEDGLAVLRLSREGQFGWWNHAPRDVWEHYCRAWRTVAHGSNPGAQVANPTGDGTDWVDLYGGTLTFGTSSSDPSRPWVLSLVLTMQSIGAGTVEVQWGGYRIAFDPNAHVYKNASGAWYEGAGYRPLGTTQPTTISLQIEGRDRFMYVSVNGTLIATTLMPAGGTSGQPRIQYYWYDSDPFLSWKLDAWAFRVADRLLLPNGRGDVRLPGLPPAGTGLQGTWASHMDMAQKAAADLSPPGTPVVDRLAFRPGRESVAVNQEANLARANALPPFPWYPQGAAAERVTAVYTGAIYLDLDTKDYAFRLRDVDDQAEVWVGRTRVGESVAATDMTDLTRPHGSTGTPKWVKAGNNATGSPSGSSGPLAGQPSGWYPIRVEYVQEFGTAGLIVEWSMSTAVGTWGAPAASQLSWIGTFNQQVRNDSHLDTLQALSSTFGYQFTVAPRSLESGEFPGVCEPRVRVGRDTELVLTLPEDAWDAKVGLDATGRAVALQADAQGIADPNSQAQLTAEVIDYAQLDGHLTTPVDYESLSDITDPGLLQARMESLLALRDGPTQSVSATGRGDRRLLDSFPLTGALAEFAWEPGDGIRLDMPEVGVVDTLPRQILGVQRAFNPDGLGPPALSFRPRPRNLIDALRKLRREAILGQRNYQGGFATTAGSTGSSFALAAPDAYARVNVRLGKLVSATAVVTQKTDATPWALQVNGTTICQVTAAGRYDMTTSMVDGYNFVQLAAIGGSTGGYIIQAEARHRT